MFVYRQVRLNGAKPLRFWYLKTEDQISTCPRLLEEMI
jgi:hypothetical protein